MTIEVVLDKMLFQRFSVFHMLRHRKQWRSPLLFALIMGVSAAICFCMHRVDGAVLLGWVLLAVGLSLPCVYFLTFFQSLRKQVAANDLLRPRKVYTLHLTDDEDGIAVQNDHEQAQYCWKNVHRVYIDTLATYLYMTPDRAFILPHDYVGGSPETLWAMLSRNVSADRIWDCRK